MLIYCFRNQLILLIVITLFDLLKFSLYILSLFTHNTIEGGRYENNYNYSVYSRHCRLTRMVTGRAFRFQPRCFHFRKRSGCYSFKNNILSRRNIRTLVDFLLGRLSPVQTNRLTQKNSELIFSEFFYCKI